jgi:hypothetical protein
VTRRGEAQQRDAGTRTARARQREHVRTKQRATERLRRIPDDPGGLLRRKFLYQYRSSRRRPSRRRSLGDAAACVRLRHLLLAMLAPAAALARVKVEVDRDR